MKKTIFCSLLYLLLCSVLTAQDRATVHQVYFASDQFELSAAAQQSLDSLLGADASYITRVELLGHTDDVGDEAYNLELSRQRVLAVRATLLRLGVEEDRISISFRGETLPVADNRVEGGRAQNRRVELLVFRQPPDSPSVAEVLLTEVGVEDVTIVPTETPPILDRDTVPLAPPLEGDTLLEVEGVLIEMSKRDYARTRNCLQITPVLDGTTAREQNLTTLTVEDELMVSCGMIRVELLPPCEGCFDRPIKVRFPVKDRTCDPCKLRSVYGGRRSGRWRLRNNERVKKVRVDGKSYYELILECPGKYNCDCTFEERRVVFRLPRRYRVQELGVYSDCPLVNIPFTTKKNKARGKLMCLLAGKEAWVYLRATNGEDTLQLDRIPLADLEHFGWRRCKSERLRKNFLGVFKRWRYKLYGRYRIGSDLLEGEELLGRHEEDQ
ncbi:MAG: OmpA family protein [Bacteroidota bacterium]